MAKLTLDQTYIYAGKFYGPGEVEIEDAEAFKSISTKVEAAAKAAQAATPVAEAAAQPAVAEAPEAPAPDEKAVRLSNRGA